MAEPDEELERIRQKKLMELMIQQGRDSMSTNKETTLDKPIDVTDATFGEIVEKHPVVVIDCWAPWCGPCRMIAPVIEELAKDHAGKVVYGKLNVDDNQAIAMRYGVMSIPTILIFKNGELVDQQLGAMPREMLEPAINKYL